MNLDFFGPNRPRNEKNLPEKIMHGAVKFMGALIVNICIVNDEWIFVCCVGI